jgi:amino acid transporter
VDYIAAIVFFIPFAFMIIEYGAAFKIEKGGIYSWMEKSVDEKYALTTMFMWYSAVIVFLVSLYSVFGSGSRLYYLEKIQPHLGDS